MTQHKLYEVQGYMTHDDEEEDSPTVLYVIATSEEEADQKAYMLCPQFFYVEAVRTEMDEAMLKKVMAEENFYDTKN